MNSIILNVFVSIVAPCYTHIYCLCRFFIVAIQNPTAPVQYVDPAMIGVLVGMALMFIIICVVLRLFSKWVSMHICTYTQWNIFLATSKFKLTLKERGQTILTGKALFSLTSGSKNPKKINKQHVPIHNYSNSKYFC